MDHGHVFLEIVIGICLIISVSCIIYLVSIKTKSIPYTVLLLISGLLISPLHIQPLELIRLTPESVMFIFLPALLFESAFNFEFREFRKIITPSFAMASIGLLISAAIIAIPLNLIFNVEFKAALLFGSVISSTDPIAVLAIFKKLGVPRKLQLLVDAESFLNDATSVICFRILLPVVVSASSFTTNDALTGFTKFTFVLLGGVLVGTGFGLIFSFLLSKMRNLSSVEIAMTIILAHSVFIFADHFLKVSGIIAVLTAGLIMGNYGRTKISPAVTHSMHQTWDFLAFLCTSCVFLLIGYEINISNLINKLDIVVIGVVAILIGRAISTYLIGLIYNLFVGAKKKIPLSWLHIANWGGLRGALPLIVLLSLPDSFEYKSIFIEITFGAILFTLLINALTISYLIKFLKLDRLDQANEIEVKITELIAFKKLLIKFDKLYKIGEIGKNTYLNHKQNVEENLDKVNEDIDLLINEKGERVYEKELAKVIKRNCLSIEAHYYYSLFESEIITEPIYKKLQINTETQLDKINQNIDQFQEQSDIKEQINSFKNKNNQSFKFLKDMFLGNTVDDVKEFYLYKKVRMLGNKKTIKQIEELKNISSSELFKDNINRIIEIYTNILSHNLKTLKSIEKDFPSIALEIEEIMINAESKVLLNNIVENLGEQGRISQKAIQSMNL